MQNKIILLSFKPNLYKDKNLFSNTFVQVQLLNSQNPIPFQAETMLYLLFDSYNNFLFEKIKFLIAKKGFYLRQSMSWFVLNVFRKYLTK